MTLKNAKHRFGDMGMEVERVVVGPYKFRYRRLGTLAWRGGDCLYDLLTTVVEEMAEFLTTDATSRVCEKATREIIEYVESLEKALVQANAQNEELRKLPKVIPPGTIMEGPTDSPWWKHDRIEMPRVIVNKPLRILPNVQESAK